MTEIRQSWKEAQDLGQQALCHLHEIRELSCQLQEELRTLNEMTGDTFRWSDAVEASKHCLLANRDLLEMTADLCAQMRWHIGSTTAPIRLTPEDGI